MSTEIKTVTDSERGCGWRKPGGLYLRCEGSGRPCGKFPIPLGVCPCCSAGIKPARGWTWINPVPFLGNSVCSRDGAETDDCASCPMRKPPERAGLIWIGEKFYPRPEDWLDESDRLGVSRRINTIPKDFEIGKTWVFAAHRLAIQETCPDCLGKPRCQTCKDTGKIYKPAMFHAFKPTAIEYVTKGGETEEELKSLVDRGITPVKVVKEGELPDLNKSLDT